MKENDRIGGAGSSPRTERPGRKRRPASLSLDPAFPVRSFSLTIRGALHPHTSKMYTLRQVQTLDPWERKDLADIPRDRKLGMLRKRGKVVEALHTLKAGEMLEVVGEGKKESIKSAFKWIYPEEAKRLQGTSSIRESSQRVFLLFLRG